MKRLLFRCFGVKAAGRGSKTSTIDHPYPRPTIPPKPIHIERYLHQEVTTTTTSILSTSVHREGNAPPSVVPPLPVIPPGYFPPTPEDSLKVEEIALRETEPKKIPFLSLDGITARCLVTKVYDGDTIHLALFFHEKKYRVRCRLAEIDTAEMNAKEPEIKKKAVEARDYVASHIYDKMIWVVFGKNDKYGRPLGLLYLTRKDLDTNRSFNHHLIDLGHAYTYKGGEKKPEFFRGDSLKPPVLHEGLEGSESNCASPAVSPNIIFLDDEELTEIAL